MVDSSMQNQNKDCIDIISTLPDHLLCKILSFLTVKEAATSSVLSTRWRHIFASIPDVTLEFTLPEEPEQELSHISKFITFGNSLFRLREGASIMKFSINLFNFQKLPEEYSSAIKSWISEAVSCKVQELDISWNRGSAITLHTIESTIFTCRTLVSLKLCNIDCVQLKGICLPLLKRLSLGVWLDDDDSLSELIHGCPLLEDAVLIVKSENDVSEQLSRSGIFRCERLVYFSLVLHYTPLAILPGSVFLPKLKALYIQSFHLSPNKGDDALQCFINNCPVLEEFHLRGLCFPNYPSGILPIRSSSLKFLSLMTLDNFMVGRDMYTVVVESTSLECLVYNGHGDENRLVVNAPNLRYFDYTGDLGRVQFPQGFKLPFSAIVSVQNNFKDSTEHDSPRVQHAFELVTDLQAAKSLWLSDITLEALYHCPNPLPTFNNMTSLKLDFREYCQDDSCVKPKRWWKMLPRLFASAPNLEVLVMERVFCQTWEPDDEFDSFEHLLQVNFPVHFVERLREIKIEDFRPCENEFFAVEYVLRNGKALKRFTIGSDALPEIRNRILSLKKYSDDCEIVFERPKLSVTLDSVGDRLESEGAKKVISFDWY